MPALERGRRAHALHELRATGPPTSSIATNAPCLTRRGYLAPPTTEVDGRSPHAGRILSAEPASRPSFTDPEARRVVTSTLLSPEYFDKTSIHELAHVILGHTDDLTEYAEHRGLMEIEAESVVSVVAGLVGSDTAAYSVGYVAGCSDADTDLIRSTAARVLSTEHQVAAILDPGPEQDDED